MKRFRLTTIILQQYIIIIIIIIITIIIIIILIFVILIIIIININIINIINIIFIKIISSIIIIIIIIIIIVIIIIIIILIIMPQHSFLHSPIIAVLRTNMSLTSNTVISIEALTKASLTITYTSIGTLDFRMKIIRIYYSTFNVYLCMYIFMRH